VGKIHQHNGYNWIDKQRDAKKGLERWIVENERKYVSAYSSA
jgi:hypothetical protein